MGHSPILLELPLRWLRASPIIFGRWMSFFRLFLKPTNTGMFICEKSMASELPHIGSLNLRTINNEFKLLRTFNPDSDIDCRVQKRQCITMIGGALAIGNAHLLGKPFLVLS